MGKISIRAVARVALAGGLAIGGIALADPAGAVTVRATCTAKVGDTVVATLEQSFELDANAPGEVEAGSTFTVTIPSRTINLPAEPQPGITVASYTNLSTSYSVSGGTVVPGSATGGASISGSTITIANPGPVPPGTLTFPQVTFRVTAGAPGTTVRVLAGESKLTANLTLGISPVTTCPLGNAVLTTTQVVAPPPPGAPNAVADTAETDEGRAVVIDVLANDEPSDELPIDVASLTVSRNPGHGTATVANGKVTYTPDAGFVGTDSFDYTICSDVSDEEMQSDAVLLQQVEQPCDTATVTVTVVETGPTGGPTTTTAAPAPSTTAAAQAVGDGGTLPRTGGSNGPLLVIGLTLVAAGLAVRVAKTDARRGR